MPFSHTHGRILGAAIAVLALAGAPQRGSAQSAGASQITDVTLYPGSATIERVARVSAGARQLQLNCLPASFDIDSLRIEAGTAIRVGDVSARTMPRSRAPGCSDTPLDKRITELEDQIAAIEAETAANELALGYLKGLGQGTSTPTAARNSGPAGIAETVRAVRESGQPALLAQHQLARRKQALSTALEPLIAERDRVQRPDAQVRAVTINLAASAAGELRLRYQIAGPGWAPSYRAFLDTRSGSVRLERLAQVAQASGEDWRGVKLRLSTGQPRAAVAGATPWPWTVGIVPPQLADVDNRARFAPAPAPAPAAAMVARAAPIGEPSFDVSVFQGAFATEFEIPGTVDLVSGEQRLTLSLGTQEVKSTSRIRSTPAIDANAYVVAEIARPEGVWPTGALQLYRDGAFIGASRWLNGNDERVELPFGRDDLVRVQIEPERTLTGSASFVGGRVERQIARAYTVQNLHAQPVLIEVLEATPVSNDEGVVVTKRLSPAPTANDWHKQPGVAQWELTLDAAKSARFSAEYTATAPKEARLTGWR